MYGETGGLRGRKADLYEGGLRVPFIIRYPKHIEEGTVSDEPAHGYDLFPTICSVLDIPIPQDREIDGIDISPIFAQQELAREEPLFWAFETRPGAAIEGYSYAARQGKWKLIADPELIKPLLYDLEKDPMRPLTKAPPNPKS